MLKVNAMMKMKSGATVIFKEESSFPQNPTDGQLCFKLDDDGGILYIYSTIDTVSTWYPLTNKTLYYVHTQVGASTLWSISHGLNTKLVGVLAYDENNEMQFTQPSFVDDNHLNLSFVEACQGKAVVFAASDKYAGMGGSGSSSYTLPIASSGTLGGIKTGTGLVINSSTGVCDVNVLDGSIAISGNILPDQDVTRNLGSATKRFSAIYVNDMHLGASSLYVNDKKVIEDVSNTITISTTTDQSVAIKTTGLGNINITSDNGMTTAIKGGMTYSVPMDNANKNITFQNASSGGIISFVASNTNGQIQFNANNSVSFTGSSISFNGPVDFSAQSLSNIANLTISGNLTVNGTTTTINATTVTTKDNTIMINNGETGSGVTAGEAGIQVDRGQLTDYKFIFDETKDAFTVGLVGDQQTVATREDSPVDKAVAFFNSTTRRFETNANLTWDGTGNNLKVNNAIVYNQSNFPVATASTVGGIKVGSGLSIDGSNVLSATYSYTLPTAAASTLGGIKVGSGLAIDGSGILSTTYTYTLPTASVSTIGGVKVGTGLTIDGNGVLAATASSGFTYLSKTSAYNLAANDYVFMDSTSAAFTLTLPSSPSTGTTITVQDSSGYCGTNNVTVARNGNTIRGIADDLLIDISYAKITFIYTGSTWLYS
jgi:hypothetical protein